MDEGLLEFAGQASIRRYPHPSLKGSDPSFCQGEEDVIRTLKVGQKNACVAKRPQLCQGVFGMATVAKSATVLVHGITRICNLLGYAIFLKPINPNTRTHYTNHISI